MTRLITPFEVVNRFTVVKLGISQFALAHFSAVSAVINRIKFCGSIVLINVIFKS